MAPRSRTPDWRVWLDRWDRQQESFNPDRERRFDAMLEVLGAWLPPTFRALDLGSGPGSLSVRIVRRFPKARVVAVDYDPVTLRLGRGALARHRRITWVDADLSAPGWTSAVPRGRFDAAVSTTALHWLSPRALRRLYRDLASLVRPGGVVLNGDILPWGPGNADLRKLQEGVGRIRLRGQPLQSEWGEWERWWRDIEREPGLAAEFAERRRRFPEPHGGSEPPSLEVHTRALRRAGFRTVDVVWQDFGNRVLVAIR